MLGGNTIQQHWSWGVRGVAPVRCLKSHCCEKIEVAVEEEDRSADLGASSGSRGRPPANMISTLRISHRWGAENRVTNVLQTWLPHCGPPMYIYIYIYHGWVSHNVYLNDTTHWDIMYVCIISQMLRFSPIWCFTHFDIHFSSALFSGLVSLPSRLYGWKPMSCLQGGRNRLSSGNPTWQ